MTLLRLKDMKGIFVLMLYYVSLARQICMFAEYLQGQLIHRGKVAVFVAGSINTSYRWNSGVAIKLTQALEPFEHGMHKKEKGSNA